MRIHCRLSRHISASASESLRHYIRQFTTTSAIENSKRQALSDGFAPMSSKIPEDQNGPAVARPSSSVLLIAPNNHILLLQRVKQSTSFASAHVFPGGNVDSFHDGDIPSPESPDRHVDSDTYRLAAIRETFEESGIVLARNNGFGRLIEVPEVEREEGRKLVHARKVPFTQWLSKKGGRADLKGLVPFTRWITPTNVPKRFTTQMYLYFLPTFATNPLPNEQAASSDDLPPEVSIPVPTTDGGIEHTNARFLPASVWLRLAQQGRIILFPPQFFLLHQIAQFLDGLPSPTAYSSISRDALSRDQLESRRKRLLEFVRSGDPPWTEKSISPTVTTTRDGAARQDGRVALGLNSPGPELKNSGRRGAADQCVLVEFKREGPRRLEVVGRNEALSPSAKI